MPSRAIPYLKALVHLLCLLPALHMLQMYRNGTLAAQEDPVNFITHFTGLWALWLLLTDLAITPLRRLSVKLAWLIRFRRMVGLYAFFYATLHLLTYVFLFSGYDIQAALTGLRAGHLAEPWHQLVAIWPAMLDDIQKRRFIQVGLVVWLILLALAVTSPQRVLRAMGGKNWQRLHYLVYVACFLALTHYWWSLKKGAPPPYKETNIFWVLMLARLVYWLYKKLRKKQTATQRTQIAS